MKKLLTLSFAFIIILSAFLASCKKDERTVAEKLAGQWKTADQYLQNNKVASADGSYLEFGSCGSQPCSGTDHKGSDNTTGSFTWALQNNDTEIAFSDTTNQGGFWNGTYTIVSVSDSRLTIKTASILGEYKVNLTK